MHKISYYLNKYKNYHQKCDGYLEGRKYSFGGAELSIVLDQNKYESFTELIDKKNQKKIELNDNIEWGRLFEVVAKKFIQKKYGTLFNIGCIPHSYYPVSYSPDGLVLTEDQKDILLIEIKCPIYRNLKDNNGKVYIADIYKTQMYTGMNVFSVRGCVFAQFRFRRCNLQIQRKTSLYDRKYHKEGESKFPKTKPIAYGYLHWDIDCPLLDLGNVEKICNYTNKHGNKFDVYINEYKKFEKGLVLLWKLFEEVYEVIEPNKDFLADHADFLWAKYKELNESIELEQKE